MPNNATFTKAKTSIDDVFGDTSVSPAVTRDRLEQLRERITECLACLDEFKGGSDL